MVAAGVGLAVVGFAGRYILRRSPNMAQKMSEAVKTLPNLDEALSSTKYYKGGFDPKMNKREASLILGVSPSANKARIKVSTWHEYKVSAIVNVLVYFGFV